MFHLKNKLSVHAALLGGVSALAVSALSMPAYAQDDNSAPEVETVVVTGIRAEIKNAQAIKQSADVFVDAITSEDIGALPDRSVTEALQRVPGVAINRFAGSNDPDHFSVEGSGVVIRGLSYVQSEFNGRDTFSVSDGRTLSFADVPPELLSAVLVFKDQSADMVEGGISGTVDLHTRMPFDSDGRVIGLSADFNYSDLIKRGSPSGSGLFSNRWDTSIGEVGILLDVSHSQLWDRSDGSQVAAYGPDVDLFPNQTVYIPTGGDVRTDIYDHQRDGVDLSAQWKSPDETMVATFSFLRSQSVEAWNENDIEVASDVAQGGGSIPPLPSGTKLRPPCASSPVTTSNCTPWGTVSPEFTTDQFNSQGVFTNGIVTEFNPWGKADDPQWGTEAEDQTRGVKQKLVTEDYAFNLKWSPTDNLHIQLDAHHVDSTAQNLDVTVGIATNVDSVIDNTGSMPKISYAPAMTVPSEYPGTAEAYYTDPGNYFWRDSMDHMEHSGGIEDAVALDATYDINDGWLKSVKFGARYSNRNQTVRYTTYNWGTISEVWGGAGAVWFGQPTGDDVSDPNGFNTGTSQFSGQSRLHPAADLTDPTWLHTYTFNNFQRGMVPDPFTGEFYALNPATNYATMTQQALATQQIWHNGGASGGWLPLAQRAGVIPGTPFLPSEINGNTERVWAGYAMLNFGTDSLFGSKYTLDGNIGVRFVDTRDSATAGAVQYPAASTALGGKGNCNPPTNNPIPVGAIGQTVPTYCLLTPAEQAQVDAFQVGGTSPIPASEHTHDNILPSLNVKFGITDDMLIRLGLSESIARPDLGLMRNSVVIYGAGAGLPFHWEAGSGNPALAPTRGDNLDLSYEWYFAPAGSFTIAGFYKQLHGVVTNNAYTQTFTNNGSTYDIVVQDEFNSPSVGKVRGFEVAYQQFYSFLPAPFDGLGIDANFTYIDSSGVAQGDFVNNNPNPVVVPGSGCSNGAGVPAPCAPFDTSKLPLQGLSRYNYNLTGIYEKGPYSFRLAYSWRSAFLLTTRDVIYPFSPIFNEATGQLDGSFFYTIDDHWKVGVQGANLLDEVTKTSQVLTDTLRAGRSWFVNDRRFTFSVRATF